MKKNNVVPSDITNLKGDDQRFTNWHKSLASGPSGNCVEVGIGRGTYQGFVGVRDSKNPAGAVLAFTPEEWKAFVAGAKDGEFDAG